ncbi:zinc ABC transporter substrate-binding protein [Desulfosarcina sp. OttesenSCG-928-A07]|nr:zinc ABC transporter substrate-binding protein [Desulfosarcina sp. OttesenSCG-928-G17]MDL2329734.1 zinc ABC transporter substrate-binding protein [Desulfosarcina sp. OttesenSCG-928-A07]
MSGALAADPISVFVTIAPQADVVQKIGKDRVAVQILVEPGADPHTYEPKPRQMADLAKTKIYFSIGIEFEKAKLGKIASMNPHLKVVHTDADILKYPMNGHHHGESAVHAAQAYPDPHIWLSPPLVMLQARTILKALQAADPDHRETYGANYRAFILSMVDLDKDLRAVFDRQPGAAFMVFHPSWGTFAHTYGLKQIAIETGGKAPKPAQLTELIREAKHHDIQTVFVQPQFSTKSAREIAKAIGGQVVTVDPLAMDWAAELRKIAGKMDHAGK